MKISFIVGNNEKTEVVITRSWFTGSFLYFENGHKKTLRSSLNPTTHVNFKLKRSYEFKVGATEIYKIQIDHTRPLFFAGFRPQKFDIFIDGALYQSLESF